MNAPARINTDGGQLVLYEAMCTAIDAAYKVDEVKDIRDKAIALETYARQAHNVEAERQACEIRLRAERKAGKLLQSVAKVGRPENNPSSGEGFRLRDVGVSEKQSHNWQKLADVPDDAFDAALADQTAKPTTNGIIRANAEPKVNPVSEQALWLWGRLKDFERDGLLAREPYDVMETMTAGMLDDTHTLAPRVARWLLKIGASNGS